MVALSFTPPSIAPSSSAETSIEVGSKTNELEPLTSNIIVSKLAPANASIKTTPDKAKGEGYIVECEVKIDDISSHADEEFAKFANILQESNSPDKQLAYILFASESEGSEQLDLLLSYNQSHSSNKRVLMDLVGLCSSIQNHSSCNDNLLNQAIELDGDNGALWLQIANYHAAKGNTPATLEAMEKAISTSHFDDYYYDNLALFMQVSKAELDIDFSERAVMAMGYHAATSVWVSEIAKFCRDEKEYSDLHNQLCLALGETMTTQNNSLIINAIGMNMQSLAYKRENNEELSLKMKKQQSDLMQSSMPTELQMKAQNLMFVDEELFQFWLSSVMSQGEAIADNKLIDEAITLSKNPYYQPCAK